ncbi:serine/threonine-protein kinase PCRK1-like [Bidens hawaiensis]|uniref:serine/threonine-protein kinase PCRK1-like n=1 Tax=Bidens hawaiensis TaxID=980011 RepID=UPI00404ACD0A
MVIHFRCFSMKYKTRTHTKSTFHTARSQLPTFYNTQTSQVSDLADNPISSSNLRVFTVAELKTATDNFCRSSRIGEGGFGKVFKGVVKSLDYPFHDIQVAVKYGDGLSQGKKEWSTEIEFLGRVKHPNLVKLVGYCEEKGELGTKLFLVYEYMPNRSLRDHLSSRSKAPLSWALRLKVAHHAACGLTYLHEDMNFQIILRDFKSSNILLDEQWNAKLSDFGVARLGPQEGITHISTDFAGTREYAAPEYLAVGHLTSKSDVWSYGVFLYELITGRRPLDRNLPLEEQKLLEWVTPYFDTDKFMQIIDPRLEGKYSLKAAHKLSSIANLCLAKDPKSRPKMSEVLEMVSKLVKVHPQVTIPALPGALVVPENEILDPTDSDLTCDDTKHKGELRPVGKESVYPPRSRPLKLLKSCFR